MIILGIDPGIAILGWGVIESDGIKSKLIDAGVITTPAKTPLAERLVAVYRGARRIIEEFKPDNIAMEELFFGKNVKTAIEVGQARGAAVVAATQDGTKLYEYTPLQVKQAVVGYGRAEKKQIEQMVCVLLGLKEAPKPDDAADAVAIALCHAFSMRGGLISGGMRGLGGLK